MAVSRFSGIVSCMTTHKHSLFVGRYQPFHDGHKRLIETVLKQGKPVVVAIRDTAIDHKNPYTTDERWRMIHDALSEYGSLVKIITIPDIDEICYGRDVGYDIRRIELDADTEGISGTKTREAKKPTHPIIWLTGNTGSGKSTLAQVLHTHLDGVVLDGNEMRESISEGASFSKEDREAHNLRVARLAKTLSKQSTVIVSVIAPFAETRAKIDEIAKPFWVYVKRENRDPQHKIQGETPYEEPENPDIIVDSDAGTPEENAQAVLEAFRANQSGS